MTKKIAIKQSQHGISVVYGIDRIITGKFSYEYPTKDPLTKNFEVNYHFDPKINFNTKVNIVFIRLVVKGTIVETGNQVVFIDNIFGYKVENLKNYTKNENGVDVFIEEFQPYLVVFVSIAISTTRGILYEKLAGTIYETKVLPIVDPNVFFKKQTQPSKQKVAK
ncbi:MAG: hypothetical protein V4635_14270 [Bacteroidota bacterium]